MRTTPPSLVRRMELLRNIALRIMEAEVVAWPLRNIRLIGQHDFRVMRTGWNHVGVGAGVSLGSQTPNIRCPGVTMRQLPPWFRGLDS